jgi:DNA-binding beta-propeller fold protein YncE
VALWLAALAFFVFAAAAAAAGSVYVTNLDDDIAGTVSQYAVGAGGLLSPLRPPTVGTDVGPVGIAVTPDGHSAYVTNGSSSVSSPSRISQYNIDPLTGGLSPKTPPAIADGQGALGVAVTPDGKSAYVAGFPDSTVSQYDINPLSGTLSPKDPQTVAAGGLGSFAFSVAVTPDGKSAYVTTFNAGVRQYNIDPLTGGLSPKSPAGVAAGDTPEGVVVTPDGKSAYVTNLNSNTISQYNIDRVTGALSPKTPATIATDTGPTNGVAVTPDGKNLYVANSGISGHPAGPGKDISQYSIDPLTGALSPKTPAAVAASIGGTVAGLAVTPDGISTYVTTGATVSQYNIDPVSGTLSPKDPAAVAAGVGVTTAIAVTPKPRVPTTKAECKSGGWRQFGATFKNQGQCVAFVERGPKG